eukprot:356878-Chlamydomonas_euryale.AAC.1
MSVWVWTAVWVLHPIHDKAKERPSTRAACGSPVCIWVNSDKSSEPRHHRGGHPAALSARRHLTMLISPTPHVAHPTLHTPHSTPQEGYELLSTHDGAGTMLIVDFLIWDGVRDVLASSVYSAGPHQALFSLSLTDVYKADFGYSSDFVRIDGFPVRRAALHRQSTQELFHTLTPRPHPALAIAAATSPATSAVPVEAPL